MNIGKFQSSADRPNDKGFAGLIKSPLGATMSQPL